MILIPGSIIVRLNQELQDYFNTEGSFPKDETFQVRMN